MKLQHHLNAPDQEAAKSSVFTAGITLSDDQFLNSIEFAAPGCCSLF